MQFSSNADVVKGAIATLKQRNPATKVLIAVGGATYTNWAGMNTAAIKRFVDDFGLDGVDIDYEVSWGGAGAGRQAGSRPSSSFVPAQLPAGLSTSAPTHPVLSPPPSSSLPACSPAAPAAAGAPQLSTAPPTPSSFAL